MPLLVLIAIGIVLIYPFITSILLAAITAYLLRPSIKRLEVYVRSYNIALIILALMIAAPLVLFVNYLAANMSVFMQGITELGSKAGTLISLFSDKLAETFLGPYFEEYFLSAEDITQLLTGYAVSFASSFVRDIPFIFIDIIVYVSATYYFLRDGPRLWGIAIKYAKTLPCEDKLLFFSTLTGLKRSFDVLAVAYITMSVITAVLALVGFYVFGVPHPVLLAILSGLFSFLPVFGVWMIYVPAGLYLYLAGNVMASVLTVAYGLIVLNFATDFIIKPVLGAKKGMVSPLTVLIGFFSGTILFGAKGVILGPVLLVVVETVIREYIAFGIGRRRKN